MRYRLRCRSSGNSNLHKLAEQTGGRVLLPRSPKDVTKAFAKIGEELRSRYAVSYKPADFTPDGHYRTIKIEARKTGDKLEIRARKGYYARAASWLCGRLYGRGERGIRAVTAQPANHEGHEVS